MKRQSLFLIIFASYSFGLEAATTIGAGSQEKTEEKKFLLGKTPEELLIGLSNIIEPFSINFDNLVNPVWHKIVPQKSTYVSFGGLAGDEKTKIYGFIDTLQEADPALRALTSWSTSSTTTPLRPESTSIHKFLAIAKLNEQGDLDERFLEDFYKISRVVALAALFKEEKDKRSPNTSSTNTSTPSDFEGVKKILTQYRNFIGEYWYFDRFVSNANKFLNKRPAQPLDLNAIESIISQTNWQGKWIIRGLVTFALTGLFVAVGKVFAYFDKKHEKQQEKFKSDGKEVSLRVKRGLAKLQKELEEQKLSQEQKPEVQELSQQNQGG